jgi:cobalt-zinc-cadmium efflux system membrane fusion protein
LGEKLEKFVEILPHTSINSTSRILTKGVFDIAN